MFSQKKNHLTTGAEGFFYVADGDKGCTRITHKNWLVFWEPLKDALVVFVKESLTWEKNSFETNGTWTCKWWAFSIWVSPFSRSRFPKCFLLGASFGIRVAGFPILEGKWKVLKICWLPRGFDPCFFAVFFRNLSSPHQWLEILAD